MQTTVESGQICLAKEGEFYQLVGDVLRRNFNIFAYSGTLIEVGAPVVRVYDGKPRCAIRVFAHDLELYLLFDDMATVNQDQVKILFPTYQWLPRRK